MGKRLLVLLIAATALASGCSPSNQIDKASLAETVVVSKADDGFEYVFFLLNSGEKPSVVTVEANNLEEACKSAKRSYIPHLSLAKFEIYAVDEKIYEDCTAADLKYMAQSKEFSPSSLMTLCDGNTLKSMRENPSYLENAQSYIEQAKKNNDKTSISCLEVFNKIYGGTSEIIDVSYITSEKELKSGTKQILIKNLQK